MTQWLIDINGVWGFTAQSGRWRWASVVLTFRKQITRHWMFTRLCQYLYYWSRKRFHHLISKLGLFAESSLHTAVDSNPKQSLPLSPISRHWRCCGLQWKTPELHWSKADRSLNTADSCCCELCLNSWSMQELGFYSPQLFFICFILKRNFCFSVFHYLPPRSLWFHPRVLGWFVCQQDYAKTAGWISTKLGTMWHGPRKNLSNFGDGLNEKWMQEANLQALRTGGALQ